MANIANFPSVVVGNANFFEVTFISRRCHDMALISKARIVMAQPKERKTWVT